MHNRIAGRLTWILIALTVLWLILLISTQVSAPPAATLDEKIDILLEPGPLFYLTYINAALLTVLTLMVFTGLALFCRDRDILWSAIGLVFLPIYGIGNLVAYGLQVLVVPGLLRKVTDPATQACAEALLGMLLQDWQGSAVSVLNLLAYAALGVPSIIFGILMARQAPSLRAGGILLAISGIMSILALVGVGAGSALLGLLSPLSGAVFLMGLVPVARYFNNENTIAEI